MKTVMKKLSGGTGKCSKCNCSVIFYRKAAKTGLTLPWLSNCRSGPHQLFFFSFFNFLPFCYATCASLKPCIKQSGSIA